MAIDPNAIGATTEPMLFEWTDRDTLLYALGVGAGIEDLSFTTENSHGITQQVLPTYAVICCTGFGAAAKVGTFNWAMLLHGSQGVRLHAPLPPGGKLSVVSEVADIQDKGEGKNAIVFLRARGSDPDSGTLVAETLRRLRRIAGAAPGCAGDPGPAARRPRRVSHPGRSAADLPALRRPQSPAQRPVVRQGNGRLPQADHAWSVHLRVLRPGVGRRTRRRRRQRRLLDRGAV
jgi:hypothetical protein